MPPVVYLEVRKGEGGRRREILFASFTDFTPSISFSHRISLTLQQIIHYFGHILRNFQVIPRILKLF